MNIPDEAVEAAARALAYSDGADYDEVVRYLEQPNVHGDNGYLQAAHEILSAALPAIERAHLERLTAEAQFTGSSIGAALIYGLADPNEATEIEAVIRWLRARLDQTKEKP